MGTEPVTADRFRGQLRQQLSFIRNSCASYDRGDRGEAIRIGTSLRVILHDTKKSSTSLLTHLGATEVPLLSTCPRIEIEQPGRRRVMAAEGLVSFRAASAGAMWVPKLERSATNIPLRAPEWWGQTVTVVAGQTVSRRDLALAAANKDGGAHVDSDLPPEYQALIEGVWTRMDTGKPVPGHNLLYLRQMGFEILNSPDLAALAAAADKTERE